MLIILCVHFDVQRLTSTIGATAVQVIPEVAKVASHVTVYQRTPNWVVPRLDGPVSDLKRAMLRYVPHLQSRIRALQMDFRESTFDFIKHGDGDVANMMREWCKGAMQQALPNQPELWEKLTPEYSPGCKRIIISDDYYPTLARDNVSLETRNIEKITPSGIVVEGDASEDFDLIVLATGFRTVEFMHPIQITGRRGRTLSDIWKGGAQALYGTTLQDMPNFGMLYGPNTNLGHNSIILMIEAQSAYINTLIKSVLQAKKQGKTLALTPKTEVVAKFNEQAQEVLKTSSFADPKCNSWYKTKDGRITNNWYGTVVDYQEQMARLNWDDYEAEGSGAQEVPAKKQTKIGRVKEETQVSNLTLALSAVSVAAVAAGWFVRGSNLLRVR